MLKVNNKDTKTTSLIVHCFHVIGVVLLYLLLTLYTLHPVLVFLLLTQNKQVMAKKNIYDTKI